MDNYEQQLKQAYASSVGSSWRPNICPGASCKFCALIRPILNFKDRYDQSIVDMANNMRAKNQYFANICFDPDYSKVILFAFGQHIMGDLSRFEMDPVSDDYKHFAHPTKGRLLVIQKFIGTNGQNQYSVTPKITTHTLPKLGMAPHNLKDIEGLLKKGVEYFPQSKLDIKSIVVRFVPYGKEQTKFFTTVQLHWGISPSDYELVQQGQYNPFNLGTEVAEPGEPLDYEVEKDGDIPIFGTDTVLNEPEVTGGELETQEAPVTPESPPCYGREYDPEDKECVECKTWNTSCKEEFLKRYGG